MSTSQVKENTISIERVFNAPIELLWEALTDNDKLKQWYFDFNGNFKPKVGHVFEWTANDEDECNEWLHRGKILEVEKNKKIVHSWEFPGYTGKAKLTWLLERTSDNNTLLKMDFEFIEEFDPTVDALHSSNFETGWNQIINTSLVNYINQLQ